MNQVVKYFSGEKSESYLFLFMGVITILFACYFMMGLKTSFWRGVAIPFIVVALLEIIVGYTIVTRTPKDITRVENFMKQEPHKIKTEEIPRMEIVMKNFRNFRYIEIILIITGIILMYIGLATPFWTGIGLGLFIQAGIVLCLDFFAESRGKVYLDYLKSLTLDL